MTCISRYLAKDSSDIQRAFGSSKSRRRSPGTKQTCLCGNLFGPKPDPCTPHQHPMIDNALADHVTAQGHGVSSQAQCSTAMLGAANTQPDARQPRASLSYLLPCRHTPTHAGEPYQHRHGWTRPSNLPVHPEMGRHEYTDNWLFSLLHKHRGKENLTASTSLFSSDIKPMLKFFITKINIYDLHLEFIWDGDISNPSIIANGMSSFLLLTKEIFTPSIFTS